MRPWRRKAEGMEALLTRQALEKNGIQALGARQALAVDFDVNEGRKHAVLRLLLQLPDHRMHARRLTCPRERVGG